MFEYVGCSCQVTRRRFAGQVVGRGGWRPATVGVWDALTNPEAPRSDWSINQMLAIELAAYLDRVRPRCILEAGSGFSTAILAAYAAHHDAEVVTLEHDPKYFRTTRRALHRLGVDRRVDLRLAPLCQHWFGGRGPYWWYGVPLDGEFDFVLIDGPPKVLGRRWAFFALQGHLRPGWRVWVDDGFRWHERHCVGLWEEEFSGAFLKSRRDIDGKGVFVLSDAKGAHGHAAPGRLGIGILGTGDPNWWRQIERNLGGWLLESSYVVVVDRGERPGRVLPRAATGFVDEPLPADGPLRQRMFKMFGSLATQRDVRCVLYLDDQWSPSTLDTGWLSRGLDVLKDQPEVEQVSLRHLVDVGLADKGEQRPFTMSFTGEPSLLRADRLGTALQTEWSKRRPRSPSLRSRTEPEPAPLWTVQLSPGVFRRSYRADRPAEVH